VYLGVAWIILPVALIRLIGRRLSVGEGLAIAGLVAATVAGVVLSMGPSLDLDVGIGSYAVLRHLPLIGAIRVPTHAFVLTVLGLSLLAALTWPPDARWARVGGAVLLLALVLDYRVSSGVVLLPPIDTLQTDPVLTAVGADRDARVLYLPLDLPVGHASTELFATVTHSPSVNGYSPLAPAAWLPIGTGLAQLGSGGPVGVDDVTLLRSAGVTDVVLDRIRLDLETQGLAERVHMALAASGHLTEHPGSERFWWFAVEPSPHDPVVEPSLVRPAAPVPRADRVGQLRVDRLPPGSMAPGSLARLDITVTNTSAAAWPGEVDDPRHPTRLGSYWIADGAAPAQPIHEQRLRFPLGIAAGATVAGSMEVQAPLQAGRYWLHIAVVQEGVAWFTETDLSYPVTVPDPLLAVIGHRS
jgi:hypothetical protein